MNGVSLPKAVCRCIIRRTMETQYAFEAQGLGVLREGRWILRDVDCRVPANALTVLLGPNGSGKSTLTRIIGGHLFPTAGIAHIQGKRLGRVDLRELRREIRLVQPAGPYDVDPHLTTLQVVLTGFFSTLDLYDEGTPGMVEQATAAIGRVGLNKVIKNPYRTLSSGEKMRSLIARALVAEPKLLLLDEPTAALDLLSREQVLATIHALHADRTAAHTTLMITHHIDEIPPDIRRHGCGRRYTGRGADR
jgi:iron complex transport system ATP-binding protein